MNGKPYILLIRDRNYLDWVLPKGHVEEGETVKQAALREVAEEAGLKHIKIVRLLGTYERFVEKTGEQKTIHYFLMIPTQNEEITITDENKKDEIAWIPLDNLPALYLPEQKDLIEKNIDAITQQAKENPLPE